jgi:signal transduction histidine kinase
MSVKKKLYTSAERKLVLWSIAAMLFMSTGFIVTAYLAATSWLGQPAEVLRQRHGNRGDLMVALVVVQGLMLVLGALLSFLFAKRALRPIRSAHQAQAEFAANAHHQLRTPIAVMQAEVDTALLRKYQQPDDYRRTLKNLLDELRLLRATSEQLLVQADGDVMPAEAYRTSEDIKRVISLLEQRHKVPILAAIAPGLYTTLSQEELAICFETLLDNSKKYAGKRPKDLRVNLTLEKYGNIIRLTFSDNGKGVLAGEEKWIFERSFRGERALKGSIRGSGLGLSILADIVRLHKGVVAAANLFPNGLQITADIPPARKR